MNIRCECGGPISCTCMDEVRCFICGRLFVTNQKPDPDDGYVCDDCFETRYNPE